MNRNRRLKARWMSLICMGLGLGLLLRASPPQVVHSIPLSNLDQQALQPSFDTSLLGPPAPTPTPPTEAGHGKDVFYLRCMACHGDLGQGLTDEFRNRQYPPGDTNCWKSGCHGVNPYENGFTLPRQIPALIGPGTLSHFNTAQDVYNFIHRAMPFDAPGSLSEEQYLQVLAFILESNQIIPAGSQLDTASLASIALHTTASTPSASVSDQAGSLTSGPFLLLGGVIIALLVGLALWLSNRRQRSSIP